MNFTRRELLRNISFSCGGLLVMNPLQGFCFDDKIQGLDLEYLKTMEKNRKSKLVYLNESGRLEYKTDHQGNRVSDFSFAGYRHSEVGIPDVKKMLEQRGEQDRIIVLEPKSGDASIEIQKAVDTLSKLNPVQFDKIGEIRGVVLLRAGVYNLESSIIISASGIILKGEGVGKEGTVLFDKGAKSHLIQIVGGEGSMFVYGWQNSIKNLGYSCEKATIITSEYVPLGSPSFEVESSTGLKVGDQIVIKYYCSKEWKEKIGGYEKWGDEEVNFFLWERKILVVSGNTITIDIPFSLRFDNQYADCEILKITEDHRIQNVGIEDMTFIDEYDRTPVTEGEWKGLHTSEEHSRSAIQSQRVNNIWFQRLGIFYYWYMPFRFMQGCSRMSIVDCAVFDPAGRHLKRKTSQGYLYNFEGYHGFILINRCYARHGRHSVNTGGMGEYLAVVNFFDDQGISRSEPHKFFEHSMLFDACYGETGYWYNYEEGGVNHGIRAGESVLWNNKVHTIGIDLNKDPYKKYLDSSFGKAFYTMTPKGGLAENWMIGCEGSHKDMDRWPKIYKESHGNHVLPRSLFFQQLKDRLGEDAVKRIATKDQLAEIGTVWKKLNKRWSWIPMYQDSTKVDWLPDLVELDGNVKSDY